MAQGTWDDFTDKYGFSDGEQLENRDFEARNALIQILNDRDEFKTAKVRALAFDRGGVHNSCLIVLVPAVEGKTDAELLAEWEASPTGEEAELPDLDDDCDMSELIGEAYGEADAAKGQQ